MSFSSPKDLLICMCIEKLRVHACDVLYKYLERNNTMILLNILIFKVGGCCGFDSQLRERNNTMILVKKKFKVGGCCGFDSH